MASRLWATGFAIESLTDEELSAQTTTSTIAEAPESTVEAQLVEVHDLDRTIETLVDDGELLAEDTDGVAEQIAIAETAGDGGMDETAAKSVTAAIESYTGKWGVTAPANARVATESFGSTQTRAQAQVIAIEGWKEQLQGMYDKAVVWLSEIYQAGKTFLGALTNVGKAFKVRGQKYVAAIDRGLGEQSADKVSGDWSKFLSVDGKFDLAECIEIGKSDVEAVGKVVKTMVTEAGDVVRAPERKMSANPPAPFGKKVTKKLTGIVPQGATDVVLFALPNDAYVTTFKVEGVYQVKYVSGGATATKDVPTMNPAAIKDGAETLIKIGDSLESRMGMFKAANEEIDRLAKELKELKAKQNGMDKVKTDKESPTNTAIKLARTAVLNAKQTEKAVTESLRSAGKGISGYVGASLNAYAKVAKA